MPTADPPESTTPAGWKILMEGFPWFTGKGHFPLPAYSEFMPSPRVGHKPLGLPDATLFSDADPWGWTVSEIEEEYELKPGLRLLADRIMKSLVRLGQGEPDHLAGHQGRNLVDNPFWPPELAAMAGKLPHERYVILLPVALSRTQDDKGRIRWTFFGSSEQGPERAFWQGFLTAPDREAPEREALGFIARLLTGAYGVPLADPAALHSAGFRILPSEPDPRFPTWSEKPLPAWTRPFIAGPSDSFKEVRYLLTFRPFDRLPAKVRQRYLGGKLALLPFPGSLVFWGQANYLGLQAALPLAQQIPLLRLVGRHGSHEGLRVPQSGWLHEPGSEQRPAAIKPELLVNSYRRTSRWDRVHRHEDDVLMGRLEDKLARVLFSTESDALGLYNKPLARNCQIWTEDSHLLLDGPRATPDQVVEAGAAVAHGGLFRYRFQFPSMRVGRFEVYWHRPLVAWWSPGNEQTELAQDAPFGFLTAYPADAPDPARAVRLWPRLLGREPYLAALRCFDPRHDYYARQTPLNVLRLFNCSSLQGGRPLPRSMARQLLRLAEDETLDRWIASLPRRALDASAAQLVARELEKVLEPAAPGADPAKELPEAVTFGETATRAFEESFWNDLLTLSHGAYINKDNADCVQDQPTMSRLRHCHRDLEALGDYLLERHRRAIAAAGMEGKAVCGEMPFRWQTDFDYELFGGWHKSSDGHAGERNILVVIPGKNRTEAVVMADHYDTAYMEDMYEKDRGGSGARLAAAGADDNHSATAALLLGAPLFLRLAREGRLERDVWLLHLTGEEFPADCLGARHFCQALVEKTLQLRLSRDEALDLSAVRVAGVFVLDMIAHNKENEPDLFQISCGRSAQSLDLALQAHHANQAWNARTQTWNKSGERRGLGRGRRSPDGLAIPPTALHPRLTGEIRTPDDPRSTLFNTDGQIFSDVGLPVVLIMENYDISRQGYHDTHDTMENIDLDYGAALAAIAIEAVARAAGTPSR